MAPAISLRSIRLRGSGYFASLNTPARPAYLPACLPGRRQIRQACRAMFSLRCEHTRGFFGILRICGVDVAIHAVGTYDGTPRRAFRPAALHLHQTIEKTDPILLPAYFALDQYGRRMRGAPQAGSRIAEAAGVNRRRQQTIFVNKNNAPNAIDHACGAVSDSFSSSAYILSSAS